MPIVIILLPWASAIGARGDPFAGQITIRTLWATTDMSLMAILLVVTAIAVAVASLYWFRAQRAKERAKAEAAWLMRELERTDSRVEVVEIWTDEQLETHDRQLANAILEKVGTDLCTDESPEAKRLCAFLGKIHQTAPESGLKSPRDFGVAWFACMQIQDRDPASQVAQLFKVLNDAWTIGRDTRANIGTPAQQTILKSIAATLVGSRTQS